MNFSKKDHRLNKKNIGSVSKKLVLTILTLTLFNVTFAQKIDFGAKAGLNYNFGGDLSELIEQTGNNFQNVITGADDKAGYHIGFWLKARLLGFYVRPEIVYTELNNSYNSSVTTLNTDFKTRKLDVPILIGTKVIGPLHIFAGPSFQYIIDTDFSVNQIENIKTNDFSVGLQIGTGLEIGKLGFDVRWEKGFSNDLDGRFLNTSINVDNRPNQIIFGLSYRFNDRK
ncbi:MAG TPA: PorT family protein [Flavobacteriia bacterium]|nr:PorT family protein [Flavobacteriia bacterium]